MNRVFHANKCYRNIVFAFSLLLGGMIVATIVACFVTGDIRAGLGFVAGGVFWLALALYTAIAYYRESFAVRDAVLIHRGVFRTREIDVSEPVRLRWKRRGAAVLHSRSTKIAIDFRELDRESRQELIHWLRFSIAPSMQEGWDRFCCQFAMLWGCLDERPLTREEIAAARRRYDWFFLSVSLLAAILGIWFAWYLGRVRWSLLPVPFLAMWPFLRRMHPTTECTAEWLSKRMAIQRRVSRQFFRRIVIWSALIVAIVAPMAIFDVFPGKSSWQVYGMLLFYAVLLWEALWNDRRQWTAEQEEGNVQYMLEEWNRYEARRLDTPKVNSADGEPPSRNEAG